MHFRQDVLSQVCKGAKVTKVTAGAVLSSYASLVQNNASNGIGTPLEGLGYFYSRWKKARIGHNPKTGEKLSIPGALYPGFKTSAGFTDLVKSGSLKVLKSESLKGVTPEARPKDDNPRDESSKQEKQDQAVNLGLFK
eukprot:Platyproteum_vivax@DN10552_c0_g1_i1.p1